MNITTVSDAPVGLVYVNGRPELSWWAGTIHPLTALGFCVNATLAYPALGSFTLIGRAGWFILQEDLSDDEKVEAIKSLASRALAWGLNGCNGRFDAWV